MSRIIILSAIVVLSLGIALGIRLLTISPNRQALAPRPIAKPTRVLNHPLITLTPLQSSNPKSATLSRKPLTIDYTSLPVTMQNRAKEWYNKHYQTEHDLTGGPCAPFKVKINFDDSNGTAGGSGNFITLGLGKDTVLNMSAPSTSVKNFEHVLAHEMGHAFWNGIWEMLPDNSYNRPDIFQEGIAEYLAQATLVNEVLTGNLLYRNQWSYLPSVVTSYDSYAIQGVGPSGGIYDWRDSTNFNTSQAMYLFAILEEASSGFLRRFHEKLCQLPSSPINPAYGSKAIRLSIETTQQLIQEAFGSGAIEGKSAIEWFKAQPVASFTFRAGDYLSLQFRDNPSSPEEWIEGKSINPTYVLITRVTKKTNSRGGEDIHFAPPLEVTVTDWQGKPYTPLEGRTPDGYGGELTQGYDIASLNLPPGAYMITAEDTEKSIEGRTYFIITPNVESDNGQNSIKRLYGIYLEENSIRMPDKISSNKGEIKIHNGYFWIDVPLSTRDLVLKSPQEIRNVFLSQWSPRLILLKR